MTTVHYRIGAKYIGGFSDGAIAPKKAIVCPAPNRGDDTWSGSVWINKVVTPVEKETALNARLDELFGVDASEDNKVRNRLSADVLMTIDSKLTKTSSLVRLRANYKRELRRVRGL